jgi:tetratricopeptide (TPR) repeat protein
MSLDSQTSRSIFAPAPSLSRFVVVVVVVVIGSLFEALRHTNTHKSDLDIIIIIIDRSKSLSLSHTHTYTHDHHNLHIMATTPSPTVIGIDLGAESTKVVLGSRHSCEIVRSDAGLHTFPTAVSFQGKLRQTGETATGNRKIVHLNRLLQGGGPDGLEDFYQFDVARSCGTAVVRAEYNGEEREFQASALLAMLLGSIQQSVKATIQRLEGKNGNVPAVHDRNMYVLTVPPQCPAEVCEQVLDAAYAAGMESVQLVDAATSYAATYRRKFPGFHNGKTCLIVDMGHGQTSVSVVQFGRANAAEQDTEDDKTDENETVAPYTVLASKSSSSLGAASVEVQLWKHFQSTMPPLKDVKTKSRAGQRLLQGCHKLKHLLSQLPEGAVTVENVGENEADVQLKATRNTLAELCADEKESLKGLIEDVLKESNVEIVDAVEIVGGGCRIPFVQAVIQDAVGQDKTLSKSLDDTSAALGAALVGETDNQTLFVSAPAPSEETIARRQRMRDAEVLMESLDQDEKSKSNLRNKMEALVLELRSAKHGKHGALLPSDDLDSYLNGLDDWLFSDEADGADLETMTAKWDEINKQIKEMCSAYYEAIDTDQKAMEKEMEEEAKRAQLEDAANAGDGDEDDHDNRRLPKKRRMEIVMKNKNEATELFKDGNYKFAAARYTKALTHCAKFVDLSPDDAKEVNDLKVTLNLNLALAYTKLENLDQALRVTNEALGLTDDSAKAFYRRAAIYFEKKRWDDAKKDVGKAKKLAEGDKAILKLEQRIDMQLKKQKEKEKKMAAKMFS